MNLKVGVKNIEIGVILLKLKQVNNTSVTQFVVDLVKAIEQFMMIMDNHIIIDMKPVGLTIGI